MNYDNSSSAWEETAVPAPATLPLANDVGCEVVIVGAGYTGLNAALRLAEAGRSVIVLDAADVGQGASGRNGGQVVPGLKHDPDALMKIDNSGRLLNFAADCADELFAFIHQRNLNCDAVQTGWMQPAFTETQLRIVTARAEQWRRTKSVQVRILDRNEVRDMTGTTVYAGGWIDPRGGVLQPLSYVRELARITIAAGALLYNNARIDHIQRSGDGWQVNSGRFKITANQVIIATNGYTHGLIRGLPQSLFSAHSVQIATEPLPESLRCGILPAGLPISDSRRLLKYFRFDRDGRFIIGGRGSFGSVERGNYFNGLRSIATNMFPILRGVRWTHQWAGKIALTLDHLPHIHNPAEGLYTALGYNGRGVAMASHTGALLAQLCMDSQHTNSPLPVTPISRVPFHLFRRPAMEAAVAWYRFLDTIGR